MKKYLPRPLPVSPPPLAKEYVIERMFKVRRMNGGFV